MTLPRPIQFLLAALGVLLALSAVAGLGLTFLQHPPAIFFFGFEVVILLASVFLVLLGTGRIKDGPAITLLCIAGTVGAGAYLGYKASAQHVAGYDITYLTAGRLLIAVLLVVAAAADIILRDVKNTLPRLLKGMLFLVPLVIIGFLFWRGSLSRVISGIAANAPALALGAWLLVLIVAGVLTCASAHFLIRAFQIGVAAWDRLYGPTAARPESAAASTTASRPAATPRQSAP